MKYIFEIVKVVGLGMLESPNVEYSTGMLFLNKEDADKEADKLWKEQTTEEDRKSGWCGLCFIVKKREIK
jgi:predicted 3-demethylubiquinone-9 3-methyltransferase (glyoxalase superfamily)